MAASVAVEAGHSSCREEPVMDKSLVCARCGSRKPPGPGTDDLCPRCLFGLGLESIGDTADNVTVAAAASEASASPHLPARIGHYRIIRLIGEGGMGAVYEAEQDQPRRVVALKVIKPGLASPDLLRRFDQEAQALGRLQHPGIAQIYEAGTADTGFGPQPYFAMEFIRGTTLREYAEQQRSSTRDRLELMARVAEAVHHAHQRGLIHRDLKPGNILVDDTGQPKILDFGVARVTDHDAQATMQTDVGQLVGTLAYMSPEQVLADPLELDTRSDVYAMGVILYELLAARLPYAISKKLHEAVHAIREEDPAKLSSVDRRYRGDIETIAAKALDKDKTRRYASAAELAADIRRYLNDEPIVARPPSTTYQLQKFARRHRALVGGLAAVFVVLVAGATVSTWQAIRAGRAEQGALTERDRAIAAEQQTRDERDRANANEKTASAERDRAEAEKNQADAARAQAREEADTATALNEFMQKDLLAVANPQSQRIAGRPDADVNADLTVREALDRAAQRIDGRFTKQPLVEAALRETIGGAYQGLGVYNQAEQQLETAIDLRRRVQGESHSATLSSMVGLSATYVQQRKFVDAEKLLTTVIAMQTQKHGENHRDTLTGMAILGSLYSVQRRYVEAEALMTRAVAGLKRVLGPNDPEMLMMEFGLATLYRFQGQQARAKQLIDRLDGAAQQLTREKNPAGQALSVMIATFRRPLGPVISEAPAPSAAPSAASEEVTALTAPNLILRMMGFVTARQFQEAEALGARLVEGARRVAGPESALFLSATQMLAVAFGMQGKFSLAEPLMREAVDIQLRTSGESAPMLQNGLEMLGSIYMAQSKYPNASDALSQLLTIRRRQGSTERATLETMVVLAIVYRHTGQTELSENLLRELGEGPAALTSMTRVARELRDEIPLPEVAEEVLVHLLGIQRRTLGVERQDTFATMSALAQTLGKRGKYSQSEALFSELRDVQRRLTLQTSDALNTICSLGWTQFQQRKYAEAETTFREALRNLQWAAPNTWEWERDNCRTMLGASLAAQRKYLEAEPLFVAGYEGMIQRPVPTPQVDSRFTVDDARQSIVDMYRSSGDQDKLVAWQQRMSRSDKGEQRRQP
jgi:predicted Ser/Thr protein kinase